MSSRAKSGASISRDRAFERLRSNLELTGLQAKTVSTRQKNVRAAAERQLTVTDSFLTGSYRRQTLISPLKQADVDVVIVLDSSYKSRGPRAVLELVRQSLLDDYKRGTKISRNGQAVTIAFTDFIVDVVPAFPRPWWAWDTSGLDICDSGRDRWITTNPKRHVEISARGNRAHGGQLVPRIKQLKAWNRNVGGPLHSFHLEALAWSIFGTSWWWYNSQPSDWAGARYFFKKAYDKLSTPLADPAGTGKDVAAYLHGDALQAARSKVHSAFERCDRAQKAFKDGDPEAMHEAYRRVFGDCYST
jgi:hypothetical protein